MAKYILSYDKKLNGVDPFEEIIKILLDAQVIAASIESPVESTFVFDCAYKMATYPLNNEIEEKLQPICFYVLAEILGSPSTIIDDNAVEIRKERITKIINTLK